MDLSLPDFIEEYTDTGVFLLYQDYENRENYTIGLEDAEYAIISERVVQEYFVAYDDDISIHWQKKGTVGEDDFYVDGDVDIRMLLQAIYLSLQQREKYLEQYREDILKRMATIYQTDIS